jgi:3'5'-cyclic nucleotide phosphodiesterase
MESHSAPGRIMCSKKTADLLIAAGKAKWLTLRTKPVAVKGKGEMECYWCDPRISKDAQYVASETSSSPGLLDELDDKRGHKRLVDWMTELFGEMLARVQTRSLETRFTDTKDVETGLSAFSLMVGSPRDEVSESIVLPKSETVHCSRSISECELSQTVKKQLSDYISNIGMMYCNNPFHNFEHACHVVMATKKLLSRVIQPDKKVATVSTAYGITSDPLTQFAIVFSALVHDVDHPGVSNAQLVKENTPVAVVYCNKSVAEQNSIALAWNLLQSADYIEFRNTLMPNEGECKRFRQLLVNSVIATDLFDPELKSFRENRWCKAFPEETLISSSNEARTTNDTNLLATIVIEHIIQASDVSHTMQHWHVYQKWNERLFEEMYQAYQTGRAEKDPTIGWYEGELWFFDHYIIPLAAKLKTCGVFGVSCDEFLNYARDNRAEWAIKGKDLVASHAVKYHRRLLKDDDYWDENLSI